MAPDIASRIRAKLSRRRHSGTPSLASSRTSASDAEGPATGHGRGNGQLSHGETAHSKSPASRQRSWSLLEPSQAHPVDESESPADRAARRASGSGSDSDRKYGDRACSDASSGIGPLDVVGERQKHPEPAAAVTVTVSPELVPTGTGASPSPGDASSTRSSRQQRPTSGPTGNDLQAPPSPSPSPSPRSPGPGALLSAASPSNLHSIHEDSSTATSVSTDNAATDTDGGFDHESSPGGHHGPADRTPDRPPYRTPDAHDEARDAVPLSVNLVAPTPTVAPSGLASHQAAAPTPPSATSSTFPLAQPPLRRQSLLSNRQTALIKTLLQPSDPHDPEAAGPVLPIDGNMVTRKIWVKRPSASATIITIGEDDLVDDVRDMILKKYANSLGRTFDAPDLAIRIHGRDQQKDRVMGPEEPMGRTLDAYFPGGQSVDEALIIDIPRRTPKASPRAPVPQHPGPAAATTIYYADDGRPSEAGEGYFPPVGGAPSPRLPVTVPTPASGHSIAVLGTGHIPPIPSPGGTRTRSYKDRPDRPRLGRTHTSSPTVVTNGAPGAVPASSSHGMPHYIPRAGHSHSRTHSEASDPPGPPAAAQPLPSSPADPPKVRVNTPPPRMSSPRPSSTRIKKSKKNLDQPSLPPGMLNGTVPPISVLIVEDNPINLKLLEAFVKRLKVRWQTAMNGVDAVKKWRNGGFHLVLMDIQLPGMNGLQATREIRRLERVNSIGVFSSSPGSSVPEETNGEIKDQDRLETPSLFKSPVIIVALTASSLQSDRHEALAAGCNDFLTKPVNFVWLERKVMEWGCMQALIDFDGWRKWKDFSQETAPSEGAKKAPASKPKARRNRSSLSSSNT